MPKHPPKRAEPDAVLGPVRTCVGCRTRRSQDQLVRLVRHADGTVAVGRTLAGRGAWLCRASDSCLEEAVRRGGFSRAFRAPLSATALEAIRADLGNQDDSD